MDPLTALSVAGTIVQFADFGTRLFAAGRELYHSTTGTLTANQELELVTLDLRALITKLTPSEIKPEPTAHLRNPEGIKDIANPATTQETFQKICSDVIKIANELLDKLDKLKVTSGKKRHWESFRKAVQSAWSKDEISSLTQRLQNLKEAAQTHTIFSIREKLDKHWLDTSSQFATLDQRTQAIISSLLQHHANEALVSETLYNHMNTILQLVRRLDNANAEEHQRTRELILNPKLARAAKQSSTIQTITASIELLSVSSKDEDDLRRSVQRFIIDSLKYPSMTSRYEKIVDAYPTTFEWALCDSTNTQISWSNLSSWLNKGSGVYWINGKAGSGKSTLMKHIFDTPKTHRHLKIWAQRSQINEANRPCCFATFFFWNSGTPEQKSHLGLLRSLLFQVLSHSPDLVSIAFPDIWATTYSSMINRTVPDIDHTLSRLTAAFKTIIHQTTVPLKLCFLVDGLDEFDGSHDEMADLFNEITKTSNVKACLSSRPWVVFSENFRKCPSLRLQDLTRPDITNYVNGKFRQSWAFTSLLEREPKAAPDLLTEIIEKSDGVFLWVQIVVDSLLKGVQNRDEIAILYQRLRSMPQELEPLYRHFLGLIEPVYQVWASKAFQIVRAYRECRSDGTHWPPTGTENFTSVTILELYFALSEKLNVNVKASDDNWVHEEIYTTTSQALKLGSLPMRYEDMRIHLTARCGGLLEVPKFEKDGSKATIQFLHRTARDFLEKNWLEILAHTTNVDFDPYISLLKGKTVGLAMTCSQPGTESAEVCRIAYNALLYGHKLGLRRTADQNADENIQAVSGIMMKWDSVPKLSYKQGKEYMKRHWTCRLIGPTEVAPERKFLALATVFGLTSYVDRKLTEFAESTTEIATQLLFLLLIPCDKWPDYMFIPKAMPEMVEVLISHGADPQCPVGRGSHELQLWELAMNFYKLKTPAILSLVEQAGRNKRGRASLEESGGDSRPGKKQR